MTGNPFFDEAQVRRTIAILKPNNELFECRILKGKTVYSGYFTSADVLIEQLKQVSLRECNVYITLNDVNDACNSRSQHNCFRQNVQTTSDNEIEGYEWMLIDFDPERMAGVSSSQQELKAARDLASRVYSYLKHEMLFEEPVKALSGNGFHLLYKISAENTPQNTELIHKCLLVLKDMFSTGDAILNVKVDEVNYNPSRICKLHGTLAQKGANTEERPHRMSRILNPGIEPKVTPKEKLEKLAAQLDESQLPQKTYREAPYGEQFDLVTFLNRNGIGYKLHGRSGRDNCDIYYLDECPFDPSHRNGDAKIFHYPDGRIAFKCHHNSCACYKWHDVRLKYEPNAYDHDRSALDAEIEAGWKMHNRNKAQQEAAHELPPELMFRTAQQIMADEDPQHEFVKSGIDVIDEKMHGLEKQCLSVITGLRGSGKSTLIGNLILNSVDGGQRVIVYSGELANKKYLNWLLRMAAGQGGTKVSNDTGIPYVPKKSAAAISEWMSDLMYLYNNQYGNQFSKIADALEQILVSKKADICIIDNMMALDLEPNRNQDKYDAQTDFVWKLKNIAIRTNTHIIFVAHPKKAQGLIRLEDVSGAGNITNIVDNAFLIHRRSNDFVKRLKEYDTSIANNTLKDGADNYLEIAKDRENGLQDEFIPLWYDKQTKRMQNYKGENKQYGWNEESLDEIPY